MKHFILCALTAITTTATAQTVLFEDNFDSYTLGYSVPDESSVWGSIGGSTATVSDEHVLSGVHSAKVLSYQSMFYPFNGVSSGAYDIEFNMFLHEQGHFSLQHQQSANWAAEIYFTVWNEILYLDNSTQVSNSIVVGTYENDEWINFRFRIDIDVDTVLFYKNGALIHSSRFSNSMNSSDSHVLDIFNFYGIAGNSTIPESYFHIDDFKVTEVNSWASATELKTAADITIFPNPAKDLLALTSDEQLEHVRITTLSGELVLEQALSGNSQQIALTDFIPGVYLVQVQTTMGTAMQRVIVQ